MTPQDLQQKVQDYISHIQISSASVDPNRDRHRRLGFLDGHQSRDKEVAALREALEKIRVISKEDYASEPMTFDKILELIDNALK